MLVLVSVLSGAAASAGAGVNSGVSANVSMSVLGTVAAAGTVAASCVGPKTFITGPGSTLRGNYGGFYILGCFLWI